MNNMAQPTTELQTKAPDEMWGEIASDIALSEALLIEGQNAIDLFKLDLGQIIQRALANIATAGNQNISRVQTAGAEALSRTLQLQKESLVAIEHARKQALAAIHGAGRDAEIDEFKRMLDDPSRRFEK